MKKIIQYNKNLKEKLTVDKLKISGKESKRKSKISFNYYFVMDAIAQVNNSNFYLFLQPSALNCFFFNKSKVY